MREKLPMREITQSDVDLMNALLGVDYTINDYELVQFLLDTDFLDRLFAIKEIMKTKGEKVNETK